MGIGADIISIIMEDLVSIVTPSFNCSEFIGMAIESVLAQSYHNWEMLITDDCSTDGTQEILQEYARKDSRIKVYTLENNRGAGVARNNSIKNSSGKYIAFLDGDDMWFSNKLERQVSFMQENKCAMSYTSYLTCDESGEENGIVVCPKKHSLRDSTRDNKPGFSTVMYDVEKVGKVYMPTIRKRQDWGLNMSVLKVCRVAYGIKAPLVYYRKGQDSLSKDKKSLVKYNIAVYQEVLGWSNVKAFFWFFLVYMPCWSLKRFMVYLYNR